MCQIIEEIAQKRASSIIDEIAERKVKETQVEDMVNSVKLLMKNAKMTVDVAFDILEIPIDERNVILKKI